MDTCAVIWTGNGDPIAASAVDALKDARRARRKFHVSPCTAWELALLVARGRLRLTRPVTDWFSDFVEQGDVNLAPLTAGILAGSAFLPGSPPKDPADRVMITTARAEDLTILTRDRLILDYATEGHVRALAC